MPLIYSQNIHKKLNLIDLGTFNFLFLYSGTIIFTDKVSNIVRIYMLTFYYRYLIMTSMGISNSCSSSGHSSINNKMMLVSPAEMAVVAALVAAALTVK